MDRQDSRTRAHAIRRQTTPVVVGHKTLTVALSVGYSYNHVKHGVQKVAGSSPVAPIKIPENNRTSR